MARPCKQCKYAAMCLPRDLLGAKFVFGDPGYPMTKMAVKQHDGTVKMVPVTKWYKEYIKTRPKNCPRVGL